MRRTHEDKAMRLTNDKGDRTMKLGTQAQDLLEWQLAKPPQGEITDAERTEVAHRGHDRPGYYGLPGHTKEAALAAEARRHEARDQNYDLTDHERQRIEVAEAAEALARSTYDVAVRAKIRATNKLEAQVRASDSRVESGRHEVAASGLDLRAAIAEADALLVEADSALAAATNATHAVRITAGTAARRRGDAVQRKAAEEEAKRARGSLLSRVLGLSS